MKVLYVARRTYSAERMMRNSLIPARVRMSVGEGLSENEAAAARARMSLWLVMVMVGSTISSYQLSKCRG